MTAPAFDYSVLDTPVMLTKDDDCWEGKAFLQYRSMAQDDSCLSEGGCPSLSLPFLMIDLKINKEGMTFLLLHYFYIYFFFKERRIFLRLMLYFFILYLTSLIKFGSDTVVDKKRHPTNSPVLALGSCQE